MFGELKFNSMQFIGPLLILAVVMFIIGLIFSLLFKWLPKEIYNYLFVSVLILGAYIWAVPMNMGFYELFFK